jgi:hypothetical protein
VLVFEDESVCKGTIVTLTYKLCACKMIMIFSPVLGNDLYRERLSWRSWSVHGKISEKPTIKLATAHNGMSLRLTVRYCQ